MNNKNKTVRTLGIISLSTILFLFSISIYIESTSLTQRKRMIDKQFDIYGNHKQLSKELNENLINPSSLRNVNTKFITDESNVYVIMEYEAKNELGYYIKNRIKGTYKINGDKVIVKFKEE